jgi:hypothetical protein
LRSRLPARHSWAAAHEAFLTARGSPLLFSLHRGAYLRLLTADSPLPALSYARAHLHAHSGSHGPALRSLLGALAYLPLPRMAASPYAALAAEAAAPPTALAELFAAAFCGAHALPRAPPLRAAADLGGHALLRIEKGNKVLAMRAARTAAHPELAGPGAGPVPGSKPDWSQAEELPVRAARRAPGTRLLTDGARSSSRSRPRAASTPCSRARSRRSSRARRTRR